MESGVALNPNMVGINMKKLLDRLGNDNKMVRLITNRAKIDPKKLSLQKPIGCIKGSPFFFRRRYQPAIYWVIWK
jgi:hypothetical protein